MKILRLLLSIMILCSTFVYPQDESTFSKWFSKEKEISIQSRGLDIGTFWSIVTGLDNNIVLLDIKGSQVLAFDREGRFSKRIGGNGQGPGEYQNPSILMSDGNGNVYVGDHSTRRISKYDNTGEFVSSFISTTAHWQAISIRSDSGGGLYLGGLKLDPSRKAPGLWINQYSNEGKYIRSFYEDNIQQNWVRMIAYFDFDILDDLIYAVKPNKYKISVFDLSGELVKTMGDKPSYIKELDPGAKLDPNKFKSPDDAREKLQKISKTWNKILRISCVNQKYLFLFIETNGLVEGVSEEYILDVIDKNGNLICGKIPTNYKFLYVDSDYLLYFLTYSDEEEALEKDPQYRIGIFRFRDLREN